MSLSRRTTGTMFAMPWIVGLAVFALYPFLASIYYSMTNFSVLRSPVWVGLDNYRAMAGDSVFWKVLWNTLALSVLCISGGIVISLGLALLMNTVRRGQTLYSSIFYVPILIPSVVSAIVWAWIYNAQCGLLNGAIDPLLSAGNSMRKALNPALAGDALWSAPDWKSNWPLSCLFILTMWSIGQTAFIYLAKMQDVPEEFYEAAEIDGASTWQKIRYVTIPTISPIILFNTIMAIIGTLQMFTEPYLIFPEGGTDRSAYFLPQYIYDNAFNFMRMGYACALSCILFVVIVLLTVLAFRLSRDRVYYAGQ